LTETSGFALPESVAGEDESAEVFRQAALERWPELGPAAQEEPASLAEEGVRA
jgi:hypothetical protein